MQGSLRYSVLIIFVSVCLLDAVRFRCDYAYSSVGWLKFHLVPETWHDARLRCRFEGAMLASPTSTQLRTAMMNAIRDIDIFTGIHATFSRGSYYTVDGISLEAITQRWAEKEPDNKNNAERCISMNSEGKFADVNCDVPRPYICHRPNSSIGANICGTPDPEYHFDTRTNKCYKFHTTQRTFERAHFVCSAEGGHLAIINSEIESQVIKDLYARYPGNTMLGPKHKDIAFIGFHTYGESADWTTLDGQSLQEAGFKQFSQGQPDNATAGEYCGSVFRNGQLNDLSCEMHFPFICEKDPYLPRLCDTSEFSEESEIDVRVKNTD